MRKVSRATRVEGVIDVVTGLSILLFGLRAEVLFTVWQSQSHPAVDTFRDVFILLHEIGRRHWIEAT